MCDGSDGSEMLGFGVQFENKQAAAVSSHRQAASRNSKEYQVVPYVPPPRTHSLHLHLFFPLPLLTLVSPRILKPRTRTHARSFQLTFAFEMMDLDDSTTLDMKEMSTMLTQVHRQLGDAIRCGEDEVAEMLIDMGMGDILDKNEFELPDFMRFIIQCVAARCGCGSGRLATVIFA